MNQCHFLGRLVAEPESRSVGDKQVVNFRLAVDRRYKKGGESAKETAFLDCEAWDTGAETISKYLHKGDPIIVHASVKQEEWEDKNTGQKRSKLKFRVNSFEFVPGGGGKKKDGDSDSSTGTVDRNNPDVAESTHGEDIPF